MVKHALVAVIVALSCACGFRSPAPVPEPPREIAVAVVAQNPDGLGIPGAIVGIGDQRGEANIDGYHIFEHVLAPAELSGRLHGSRSDVVYTSMKEGTCEQPFGWWSPGSSPSPESRWPASST